MVLFRAESVDFSSGSRSSVRVAHRCRLHARKRHRCSWVRTIRMLRVYRRTWYTMAGYACLDQRPFCSSWLRNQRWACGLVAGRASTARYSMHRGRRGLPRDVQDHGEYPLKGNRKFADLCLTAEHARQLCCYRPAFSRCPSSRDKLASGYWCISSCSISCRGVYSLRTPLFHNLRPVFFGSCSYCPAVFDTSAFD
jgi:hypothetical protein